MAVAMASAASYGVYFTTSITNKYKFPIFELKIHSWPAAFVSSPPSILEKRCVRLSSSMAGIIPRATPSATSVENDETDTVPTPKLIIDLDSDPDATVVEITFGDRLGALMDTMNALKNLGLNVAKANVYLDSSGKHKFMPLLILFCSTTGRKVEDPELLEAIRLTIINNLLEYHPVITSSLFLVHNEKSPSKSVKPYLTCLWFRNQSSQLWVRATFGVEPPKEKVDVDIATHIRVYDDGPDRSLLYVEAADRPGLLVDLVKTITDINITVESGEFDTEGLLAKAKFHVSYKGKAISRPLQQINCS
ncbi:ACT domain repeats 11 [Hibiscus trionum]|uniref:ACT domain-containing protein ACR n=1 Tax=Hibiscus trionum TaxID=183268 RepID=A0A9W7JHB9_HIBTR|nr:ACT domain repeats 11 [Hibiscus trionum]